MKLLKLLDEIKEKTGNPVKLNNASFLKRKKLNKFLGDTDISQGVINIRSNKRTLAVWIRKYLDDIWRQEWTSSKRYQQTKFWLSTGPDPNLSSLLIKFSREKLGKALQFFTGHGWWAKHLHTVKLKDLAECNACCEEFTEETPIHLFNDCDAFVHERMLIFGCRYDPVFNADWLRVLTFQSMETLQDLIAITDYNVIVIPPCSTQ